MAEIEHGIRAVLRHRGDHFGEIGKSETVEPDDVAPAAPRLEIGDRVAVSAYLDDKGIAACAADEKIARRGSVKHMASGASPDNVIPWARPPWMRGVDQGLCGQKYIARLNIRTSRNLCCGKAEKFVVGDCSRFGAGID